MAEYVYQCIELTGGAVDNLDAQDPSAFTGKEIAITVIDPTLATRKVYMHQAVNSGAAADGINIIAPVVASTWRWHILPDSYRGDILIVEDQELSGTAGGSSLAGVNTRVLNTVVTNGITGASLASNQITLPAGTFLISADAPTFEGTYHQVYLYNVTSAAEIKKGANAHSSVSNTGQTHSSVDAILTITVPTVIELRHYITASYATSGLGNAVSDGTEVYARMTIIQLA